MIERRKRGKVQLACHSCRARKTGCDTLRPSCTPCMLKGWQGHCRYPQPPPVQETLTLSSLEKRVRRLEEKPPAGTAGPPAANGQAAQTHRTGHGDNHERFTQITPESNPLLSPTPHGEAETSSSSAYDLSSNSAFVKDVVSAIQSTEGRQVPSDPRPSTYNDLTESTPLTQPLPNAAVLPPRHLFDTLLESYWTLFHPLFPLLHRPTLTSQLSQLWHDQPSSSPSNPDTTTLLALLNMLLAIASNLDESSSSTTTTPAEKRACADAFLARSLALLSADTLDRFSLASVQVLVLRGMYLLHSPYAERCWSATSVAIGAAQCIGLDSARIDATTATADPLARDLRRRAWHCCRVLDALVSFGFGRPFRIPLHSAVPLPLEIDDEHITSNGVLGGQPDGLPSRNEYLRHMFRLAAIGDAIAESLALRGGHAGLSSIQELGRVLDASAAMDRFLRELPAHLRVDGGAPSSAPARDVFALQARLLRGRVLFVRLIMLRPFLLRDIVRRGSVKSGDSSSCQQYRGTMQEEMCRLCIKTAHEVLGAIHHGLTARRKTPVWHAMFFTFAAASVLVAASFCPELGVDLSSSPARDAWTQTEQIFEAFSKQVESARNGMEALQWFRNLIAGRARREGTSSTSGLSASTPMTVDTDGTRGEPVEAGNKSVVNEAELGEMWSVDWEEWLDSAALDVSWFTTQSFTDQQMDWKEAVYG